MSETIIWHNPRCSKSRQTLALLEEQGASFEEVRYLDRAPSIEEIQHALALLGLEPRGLMRRKEAIYKELGLDGEKTAEELVQAMHENPKLIERPVVFHNGKAALGRPPENILALFEG